MKSFLQWQGPFKEYNLRNECNTKGKDKPKNDKVKNEDNLTNGLSAGNVILVPTMKVLSYIIC